MEGLCQNVVQGSFLPSEIGVAFVDPQPPQQEVVWFNWSQLRCSLKRRAELAPTWPGLHSEILSPRVVSFEFLFIFRQPYQKDTLVLVS